MTLTLKSAHFCSEMNFGQVPFSETLLHTPAYLSIPGLIRAYMRVLRVDA